MEPTPNFAAGLSQAREELRKEGKLSAKDDKLVGTVLAKPVMVTPEGRKLRVLYRLHVRVRAMYAKLKREAQIRNIDWLALVMWIKEHWFEIVQVILTIVPFLL